MAWLKAYLLTMAVVKELLRYLREHRKCSLTEQVTQLNTIKDKIALARTDKKDLNITV